MKHRKTHEIAESSLAGGGMNGGLKQTMTIPQTAVDGRYRHNSTGVPPQTTLSVGSGIQLKDTTDNNTMTVTTSSTNTPAATTPSRRSHREQGEKRFQCMQCSKKFPTSKDLKRHDVVHTGRPFVELLRTPGVLNLHAIFRIKNIYSFIPTFFRKPRVSMLLL